MNKAEFLENWKPSYMGGEQWLHLADARRRFESDLDALLKEEAVEFGKHSCSEKDISKQRDIEWNEFYDNWKQLNK